VVVGVAIVVHFRPSLPPSHSLSLPFSFPPSLPPSFSTPISPSLSPSLLPSLCLPLPLFVLQVMVKTMLSILVDPYMVVGFGRDANETEEVIRVEVRLSESLAVNATVSIATYNSEGE